MGLESRCGGTLWERACDGPHFYEVLTAPGGFREDATLLILQRQRSINTRGAAVMAPRSQEGHYARPLRVSCRVL